MLVARVHVTGAGAEAGGADGRVVVDTVVGAGSIAGVDLVRVVVGRTTRSEGVPWGSECGRTVEVVQVVAG